MSEELVRLFISYSHADERLRAQLDKHLAPLKGQKVIEAWHDRKILAGDEWANQIDDNLNKADIILLLVSPDFIESEYCSCIELEQAVKRHEAGEAIVVPVILEPCDWKWLPFAEFQAFPKDGKAISTWDNQNEAFLDVAIGLRKVAQDLFAKRQQRLQQQKADREEYKAKVEEALSLATGGEISVADRDTLDELRDRLGLTKEEADAIEDQAYKPFKDREEKLEKYKRTLCKYIERGDYPFSTEVTRQLEIRQRDLGIKTEDIEKVTQPILTQAEAKYQERVQAEEADRQRQSALEAETQRQRDLEHQQKYESKLRHYEDEFSKAVQGMYPLSESAWNGLRAFQQSLELSVEDVDLIEQPIRAEAETKYQEKLQAEAAERQRQLELEQAEYEQKLQRYEQEFSKEITSQYPLDQFCANGLKKFQQQLELSDEDVARIEAPLIAPKKAAYEQRLAEEQRRREEAEQHRKEEAERQLELERQQELEQQRQEQLNQEADKKQRQADAQSQQAQQEKPATSATQITKHPDEIRPCYTLGGHSGGVRSVAFSPDGHTIASGCDTSDPKIRIWNFESKKNICTLSGHSGAVRSVAFSPDGETLASGSDDTTIKLWNWKTGQEERTLKEHIKNVPTVAFSPDGETLASGSDDTTIKLWSWKTGQEICTLNGHSSCIQAVAFSLDGKALVSAGYETFVWDLSTRKIILDLTNIFRPASVAISPDSQTLVCGFREGKVVLWDLPTGSLRQTIAAHKAPFLGDGVNSVAISPDGQVLATVSGDGRDKSLKLWDLATLKCLQTLTSHNRGINSVAFSPDGQALVTGSYDQTVIIWC